MTIARITYRTAIAALLGVGLILSGCGRKTVRTPTSPPSAPENQEQRPSTPAPTPTTTPGTTSAEAEWGPVFFGLDSYALDEAAQSALDRSARALREHPDWTITLEGHCDERGTAEYNQSLGELRAQAARDYLVNVGVASNRIRVVSFGKERPFDDGHNESAWARNRRAQIVLR